jgi:hypothetical protein
VTRREQIGAREVTHVDERSTLPDAAPWPGRLLALAVALLVTGPALGPGFVLLRDMVFVPRQDLDLDALGLSGALPRAVPVDALMALVTAVVPGDLVQKAVLLGTVYAAVLGAGRLVPPGPDGRRGLAGAVAGLVYGWSPYLAERLLMGHWTLLVAWAALPWIARAALRLRDGGPRALPWLVVACAPAALSPTGALLAAGVAVAVVGCRRAVLAGGTVLALSLPWLVAGALSEAGGASDPAGVAAFAARAEGWGGPLLSLLGTGGIWNAQAVPPSRGSVLLPVVTLLLVALAVLGWLAGRALRGPGRWLVLLGVLGVVLAWAGTLPGTADLLELLVRTVPGTGLLRDGQKWIAWWALPLAVGAGLGARRLTDEARLRGSGRIVAVLLAGAAVVLPLIAVPDLTWGVGGRLQPVDHPSDWQRVRDVLAADRRPGDVLVLPFGAYRAFDWNDDRPQLDPAARWLSRPTLTDDELLVGGRRVAGEDLRAREAGAAASDPGALTGMGVGWVLVEHGTPGRAVPVAVEQLSLVLDGTDLDLYRLPGAGPGPEASPGRVTAVVLAHACALVTVVGAVLWIMTGASTVPLRRRPLRKRVPE